MNEADILTDRTTIEETSLEDLDYWLQYGKHSWLLFCIVWIPHGLISWALEVLMVIFTPYMLWKLNKAKWNKSLILFLAVVVLPFVVFKFLELENQIINFLISFLPYATFFIYTYILSYMIGERLNTIKTIKKWKREEMIKNS